jgi:hypothetical protein
MSSRAAQTARDLTGGRRSHKQPARGLGTFDLRGARKRSCVTAPATVRSLGALRQPRDDRQEKALQGLRRQSSDFRIPPRSKCWRDNTKPAASRNSVGSISSFALIRAASRKNQYITASQARARKRVNPPAGTRKSASNQVASGFAAEASFLMTLASSAFGKQSRKK